MKTQYRLAVVALAIIIRKLVTDLPLPLPCVFPAQSFAPNKLPNPTPHPVSTNTRLKSAHRLFENRVIGSESVAVAQDGTLYTLDRYGWLRTAKLNGSTYELAPQPLAFTGHGRPLGFHFSPSANTLIICDSLKGLIQLDLDTEALSILSNRVSTDSIHHPGEPITYANDLDIGKDGSIYFSSSTRIPPALNRAGFYDTMASYLLTVWHGAPTGKLLKYSPSDRKTVSLMSERIWFANGVALSSDDDFVLVVETPSMRVLKHWLQGPLIGTTEVFIGHLPGFPDGITKTEDGEGFWLSLLVPNMPVLHAVLKGGKYARWAVAWILQVVPLPVKKWGMVLKVSPTGEILETLMDPDGSHIYSVASVTEHQGRLFMGNLAGNFVSYVDLDQRQV